MDKEEIKQTLLQLESIEDLNFIIEAFRMNHSLKPVRDSAIIAQAFIGEILKDFSQTNVVSRIKSPESMLFSMLCSRKRDLNQVNDFLGFRSLVPTIDNCYELLEELLSDGFSPYWRVFDSLDRDPTLYRSLDINLHIENVPFQLQIRTPTLEQACQKEELAHEKYKKKRIEKFKHYLHNDKEWGIEFRLALLKCIQLQFEQGHALAEKASFSFKDALDAYSEKPLNYHLIRHLQLSDRSSEILGEYL
ncbi:hypothetical protein HZA98_04120 [Candidatus Woesearchaeota archaeon]|nr:hypothetical protein [Candidatus Woesearchaeota archaeon]